MSLPPVFRRVRVTRSSVFSIMFCRSLFVLWSFFFWPLCCLFSCLFLLAIVLSVLLSFFGQCVVCSVFYFWALCCLFFFDLRILITPLVSSNTPYFNFMDIFFLCTNNLYYYEAGLFFKGFPEKRIYKRRLNRISNLTLAQC